MPRPVKTSMAPPLPSLKSPATTVATSSASMAAKVLISWLRMAGVTTTPESTLPLSSKGGRRCTFKSCTAPRGVATVPCQAGNHVTAGKSSSSTMAKRDKTASPPGPSLLWKRWCAKRTVNSGEARMARSTAGVTSCSKTTSTSKSARTPTASAPARP